jgi:diacylglycerol kinase family enzyme
MHAEPFLSHTSASMEDVESGEPLLLSQSGWALRDGSGGSLSLSSSAADFCGVRVLREDAAGAAVGDDGSLIFYAWPHASSARTARKRCVYTFEHAGSLAGGAAAAWVPVLSRWALSLPLTGPPAGMRINVPGAHSPAPGAIASSSVATADFSCGSGSAGSFAGTLSKLLPLPPSSPRALRVYINPNAGSGGGERSWARVAPMLQDAGLNCQVVVTRRAGEAREAIAAAPANELRVLEGIVVVGGDGTLAEVVDGLMARRDWAVHARSLALGALPSGSGNGLAVSLCASAGLPYSADNAAWAVAKGAADPIDVASAFCLEDGVSSVRDGGGLPRSLPSGMALTLPADSPTGTPDFYSCDSQSAQTSATAQTPGAWPVAAALAGAAKNVASSPASSPHIDGGGSGGGGGGGSGAGAIAVDIGTTESLTARALEAPLGRDWGVRRWSFLSLEWALPADLDLESENLRCLGAARFDVYAVLRVISLRRYRGRFSYVPAEQRRPHESCVPPRGPSSEAAPLPAIEYLVPFSERPPATRWKTAEGTFTFLWATNTSHQAQGVSTCASTRHDSGAWTVTLMREPSQCSMLNALLALDAKGSFAEVPGVEVFSVVAWRLEPEVAGIIGGGGAAASHTGPGCIALDGERLPYAPVQAEIHEKLLRVYARPRV